jgi:hypothetical protein
VIVFYFNLNNFSYSVCKICVHIRLLMCVLFLSCRATALQTAIECKVLQKLDVVNTVHDFVCVCARVHVCTKAIAEVLCISVST